MMLRYDNKVDGADPRGMKRRQSCYPPGSRVEAVTQRVFGISCLVFSARFKLSDDSASSHRALERDDCRLDHPALVSWF